MGTAHPPSDLRLFGAVTAQPNLQQPFDRLLERAGLEQLAGDAATALQAYRRLLDAMDREDDEGGFPGAGTPEELVAKDIGGPSTATCGR